MNLASSFSAGLLLLNMISLPLPFPGTETAFRIDLTGIEDAGDFASQKGTAGKNVSLIQSLQAARYILRSA